MDMLLKKMVVYKLKNNLNEMIYVGQTTRTLGERLAQHLCDDLYVDRAIRKYGLENFDVEILEECASVEELKAREIYWIATLNCKYPNGYNFTNGGEGSAGCQWSLEACKQLSIVRKNYYEQHPEAGAQHSITLKKFYIEHPEMCKQISASLKQYYAEHPEAGKRRSAALKKFYAEHPEMSEQISASLKQYYAEHPEAGERRSAALKKFYAEHPEMSEQLSTIRKQNYAEHPEIGIKISESLTNFYAEHPEMNEQLSASLKQYYAEHPETRLKIAEAHFKAVLCIGSGVIYPSVKTAAAFFALNPICISAACRGKQKTAGGQEWAFVENL